MVGQHESFRWLSRSTTSRRSRLSQRGFSFWLLGLALRQLPVGTAYAVWTGLGAVGAAVFGIALFGESPSMARIGCIALIVLGIAGLKVLGGESAA
jgi:quaternary ammonium compound-resistance protein SugE